MSGAHSFEPTLDHTRALRDAFGCFGTGVTIVCAQTPDGPVGMTANSFSAISLDPPLVLWAPSSSSKRHAAFVAAQHFCVHILAAEQLKMAKHFASNGTDFDTFDWHEGPFGAPTLKGCLTEFHCDTDAIHPAGDHSLILGRVRHVVHDTSGGNGLLFDQGRFGQFTPAVMPD
ncbi:flavin reductase family protein [Roseobacter sp. OBYS 0001]|uniref:flavin reductase family protein n=1 Tax=Roseobacter sp. OBYS 0001 TaxID=882651 RepID=UPI001C7E9B5E|nr:flavin reductase family protein [Roseobacter sp. OBYS 0001]